MSMDPETIAWGKVYDRLPGIPFHDLLAKLTPEQQQRVAERTAELTAEIVQRAQKP